VIFLDTGFLFALFVEGDANHERVKAAFEPYRGRPLGGQILTTNYIVDETVTLLRRRGHPDPKARYRLAIDVGERLLSGVFGDLHHVTEDDDQEALAYLAKHDDQLYSFTDCVSFVLMERLGIREALAIDKEFTHRFVAIPGPAAK
jgi:predicted nucleic acid-binding protein